MAKDINYYLMTSVDDCRISLQYATATDLPVLRKALEECSRHNTYKTKATLIARRIKKLGKEVA